MLFCVVFVLNIVHVNFVLCYFYLLFYFIFLFHWAQLRPIQAYPNQQACRLIQLLFPSYSRTTGPICMVSSLPCMHDPHKGLSSSRYLQSVAFSVQTSAATDHKPLPVETANAKSNGGSVKRNNGPTAIKQSYQSSFISNNSQGRGAPVGGIPIPGY